MALGIDPTVDYVFKRLFGDPQHIAVLVHLLNAIFEGIFQVDDVEILSPILDKEFADDKMAVLDVHVRDTQGRLYNLEMQTTAPPGLPNRLHTTSRQSTAANWGNAIRTRTWPPPCAFAS